VNIEEVDYWWCIIGGKVPINTWFKGVGEESSKTWYEKVGSGFFSKYMKGQGLDIGGKGYINSHSILPNAILVDLDYPDYDGKTLPFEDNSQDFIYNSHCLEHIDDYQNAIRDWFRVTKKGGHIIITVPHAALYEKKDFPPSRFNGDHKRFYTPASLLREIEESLHINSYRIRHLMDNDKGHNYEDPPEVHGRGLYEIEVVVEKL